MLNHNAEVDSVVGSQLQHCQHGEQQVLIHREAGCWHSSKTTNNILAEQEINGKNQVKQGC